MRKQVRRGLSGLLAVCMLICMLPTFAVGEAAAAGSVLSRDALVVKTTGEAGDFPLVSTDGNVATLWVSETEETPVTRVVNDLQADIKRVTGKTAAISVAEEALEASVVEQALKKSMAEQVPEELQEEETPEEETLKEETPEEETLKEETPEEETPEEETPEEETPEEETLKEETPEEETPEEETPEEETLKEETPEEEVPEEETLKEETPEEGPQEEETPEEETLEEETLKEETPEEETPEEEILEEEPQEEEPQEEETPEEETPEEETPEEETLKEETPEESVVEKPLVKPMTRKALAEPVAQELPEGPVVIVGTIGTPQVAAKLTADETAALTGAWEKYLIKVVDDKTLVIAGSDNRGAIFGVYELSERMGVSPWYYFADVPVQTKSAVYIPAGTCVSEEPDVQYRGIFINDEEKLSRWVSNVFNPANGGSGTMGAAIYARIFELILRLKGNYIWAAMHVNSFNNIQENIDTLHEYGVVLGSSHCDMLLRTNVHEWSNWVKANGAKDEYDYTTNKDAVLRYWRENAERHKDTEAQWTVGMRGKHDEGFDTKEIMNERYAYLIPAGQADTKENRQAALLSEVIEEQQKILKEVLGEDKYKEAFMAFIPYKEVLPLYNNPCFHMADNVTVIWPDDNHGMVRHVPTEEEYGRSGGSGLYYHCSYWAPADQSYLWMSSLPLSVMGEELSKSWSTGIQKAWVLNVGDIKPLEGEMEYFIRCGWDVEKYTPAAREFEVDWMYRNFGMAQADREEVADILTTFYQHTNVRKVDHMRLGVFEQTNYNEWDKRMAVYQDLYDRAAVIAAGLDPDQQTGFYELVQCKINWAYLTNKMFYYAEKSNLAYDQGRMASAENFSKLSIETDNLRRAEIQKYSTIADGKWYLFIDPENHAPPVTTQRPGTNPALVIGDGALGAVVQGEALPVDGPSGLTFSPYGEKAKFIDVFNKGAGSVSWSASASETWVKLTDAAGTALTSGQVTDETRIWVSIDGIEDHKGQTASITITGQGFTKTVNVTVENVSAPSKGYLEADGYVSMQAEHYTNKGDVGGKTWELLENAGRGFDGDMMRCTDSGRGMVSEDAIAADAPWMEYTFTLTSSGQFPLEVYRLPTLNATNGGQVRFAYSVDGAAPVVVSSTAADEGTTSSQNPQWVKNLFRQIERHVVMLPDLAAGEHTLKIYMVDNLIALDKLVIYTTADGEAEIPASALGPDESYCVGKNTSLGGPVAQLPRTGAAVEKKDLSESWGTGAFVENGGKVSLEAEYAMVNDLDSASEITEDMDAYAVAKLDVPLPEKAGVGYSRWRFTQSDTGYGVRLADDGLAWSQQTEFENNAPELTYMVDFTTAGTYNVWIRVRMVDNSGDSLRFGLNHSMNGTSIKTGQWWEYGTDEKWQWYNIEGKLKVTAQGVQPFHIWMREDGIYLDRIYLTTGSERPSDDDWTPSARSGGAAEDAYKQAVEAKREQIMGYSYPVGSALGDYDEAAYNSLMEALQDAVNLVGSASYTEAKGEAALALVDERWEALKKAQKLTENGVIYYAYRDFEDDQQGKYPFGVNDLARDGGATVAVMEENGNQFLRLATTSDAKHANLSYPYSDKVTATADQRVVIEMKGRFHGGQFSSIALPYGSNNQQAMFVAFDNASSKHQLNIITNGSKKDSGAFQYDTWHDIKIVADMVSQSYMVYMDGTAASYGGGTSTYNFRNGVSDLVNHTFGIDNFSNAQVDFDDIRVTVMDAAAIETVGGTVTVQGTAQWGQELTADVSQVTPAGAESSLTYVWKDSDGKQVGTGKTYTPSGEDVGKTLTVTVSGTGAYMGSLSAATGAVATADNTQGQALAEYVTAQREKLEALSIPVGSGLGCYGFGEHTALVKALDAAEVLSAKAPSLDQVTQAKNEVEAAWTALDASLNLGGSDQLQYYAYRDFDGDDKDLFPYGFTRENGSNDTVAVMEERGNKFLRLTTAVNSGKISMFLPYSETVIPASGERIIIEYRMRNVDDDLQYINGAMIRNNAEGEHYAMVTAVDNLGYQKYGHQLRAHDGSEGKYDGSAAKRIIGTFTPSVWHEIKMIGDPQTKTYMVYLDGVLTGYTSGNDTISEYTFRNINGTGFTGQRFGTDNKSGVIDFDDFKVYVAQPSDVLAVAEVPTVRAALGLSKADAAARLPEKLTLTLGDGSTVEADVVWDCADYDGTVEKTFTFTGTLTLPDGVTNSKNLVPTAKVTLGKQTIACVGDSVTYGSGGTNNVCNITDRNTQSYPAQLQKLLNGQYEVGNFGVSGACMVEDGTDSNAAVKGYANLSAYTDSLNYSPDIVVIMLGTNDSKGLNWDNFKQNYVRDALNMIRSYKSLKSDPQIYIATSPTVGEGSNGYGIQGDVVEEQIVSLQRQIALAADVGLIDVHEATRNATSDLFPDKVHGSEAGYRLIAQTVKEALTASETPKASSITAVKDTEAATVAGFVPEMPFVEVTYQDGSKGIAAVDWALTDVSFDEPGMVSVSGTLTGMAGLTATCNVSVSEARKAVAVKATADSQESANPQENVIDGDKNTRWAASGAQLPQDVVIELDGTYTLDQISITWYNSSDGKRRYQYTVYASEDGENYTQVVDRSGNGRSGVVNDAMNGVDAKYVKITTTGKNGGSVSIWEVELFGTKHSETGEPVILTSALAGGRVAEEYSAELKASGNEPITWSVTEGTLPDGLTLTENGTLRGVPTKAGNYSFTVTASNAVGSAEKVLNIHIAEGTVGTVEVTGVSLDRTELSLYSNRDPQTAQLTAAVEPENAADKRVVWTSSDEAVATVSDTGLVSAVGNGSAVITVTTADGGHTAQCTVTVSTYSSGGSSGGSGSSTKTEIIKNPDGSETRVVTNLKTGTVTETTVTKDGVKIEVVTRKDGTVTETVTDPDGGRKKTVTAPNGSVSVEVTDADGRKVKVDTAVGGATTAEVTLPENSQESLVLIPVKDVTPGTVVILVQPDGTEKLVKDCVPTQDGMALVLGENAKLRLEDHTRTFVDVEKDYWGREAIEFVSGRELLNGTSSETFAPRENTTRAMIFTVLARMSGVDTDGGENWYSKAMAWAVETEISDGTDPEGLITREQLATMLYRWYGLPEVEHGTVDGFQDAARISDWAEDAMNWAVETGLLRGKDGNRLDPNGNASRAEVAAMLQRFITLRTMG